MGRWVDATDQRQSHWPNGHEKLGSSVLSLDGLSWTGRDGRRASSCADNRQHAHPPDPSVHCTHANTTLRPPTLAPHDLGSKRGLEWNPTCVDCTALLHRDQTLWQRNARSVAIVTTSGCAFMFISQTLPSQWQETSSYEDIVMIMESYELYGTCQDMPEGGVAC